MYGHAFINITIIFSVNHGKTLHPPSMVPVGWDYSEPYCCVLVLLDIEQGAKNQLPFKVCLYQTQNNNMHLLERLFKKKKKKTLQIPY